MSHSLETLFRRGLFVPTLFGLTLLLTTNALGAALPGKLADGQPLPSLAPVLAPLLPAVVNISTRSQTRVKESPLFQDPIFRYFFNLPDQPRERIARSLGSGVVVDGAKGYIITNHHVVDKADEITVTLRDGRTLQAQPVGSDPDTDVAIIRVPTENLTAISLGDSDGLRVGDFVVAVGNPFGLGQTVTSGIVSALGRSGLGIEGYEDFIQTDASINPGNSGGALVNLRGELVGINTAILAPSGGNVGIGFAIPVNLAHQVMVQLIEHGRVQRGQLGAQLQDLTPELAAAFRIPLPGAVVARVSPGSTAARAGLEVGDVITAINGRPVRGAKDLRNSFGLLPLGAKAELTGRRGDHPLQLTVRVAETPQPPTLAGSELDERLQGATFGQLEDGTTQHSVVVVRVQRNSPAAQLGLKEGDVITTINRRPVTDLEGLRQRTNKRPLVFGLRRDDSALTLVLR